MKVPAWVTDKWAAMPPKRRQWAMLGGLLVVGIGMLWLMFEMAAKPAPPPKPPGSTAEATKVTNVGVMTPGSPIGPLDRWVGDAGKKVAILEDKQQDQDRKNKNVDEFQKQVMERFGKLEERVASVSTAASDAQAKASRPVVVDQGAAGSKPAGAKFAGPDGIGMPPGSPMGISAPGPALLRVAVAEAPKPPAPPASGDQETSKKFDGKSGTVESFLPVSFTPGIMLGGLDAPTGGQAQSNPHPVIIRLEDNAFLPNEYRSNVKECFVIAAGYGDLASERAYLRTESLSCVRQDGSTIEVQIAGVVYGEDGKVGIRGRLVTKQGQMLANALLAGVVGGLGQGFANYNSTVSSSAIGTIATTSGDQAFRSGIGQGVGRAMDRLANYYIKLAENVFPVIEVDAGRKVDVVITKGVRIQGGDPGKGTASASEAAVRVQPSYYKTGLDDDY